MLSHRCDRQWAELSGAGTVRGCDRCDRPVYDLDAMATADRARLLASSAPACVRLLSVAAWFVVSAGEASAADPADPPTTEVAAASPAPAAEVMGALDRSVIRLGIHQQFDRIDAAYHDRLAAVPSLAGTITVRFTIVEGAVTLAEVARSTVGDELLEAAVLDAIRAASFPPGGTVVVSYPFVFDSGGAAP